MVNSITRYTIKLLAMQRNPTYPLASTPYRYYPPRCPPTLYFQQSMRKEPSIFRPYRLSSQGSSSPSPPLFPALTDYRVQERALQYKAKGRPTCAAFACPYTRPKVYSFTKHDIETILYGYVKDERKGTVYTHALSGFSSTKRTTSVSSSHDEDYDNSVCTPPSTPTGNVPDGVKQVPAAISVNAISVGNLHRKGVFSKQHITKGTRFGPYTGHVVNLRNHSHLADSTKMWEVFSGGKLSHLINGSDDPFNWMKAIHTARYRGEQNIHVVQDKMEIFYEATRDIKPGEELLVWYSEDYDLYMDLPMTLTKKFTTTAKANQSIPVSQEKTGSFPCNRCGKIFSYEYYRDKHLKYTRCVDRGDRKYRCQICPRSFEKKDRLRIHVLHVHEKHRPHVCKTCGKRFSQSSSLNKHARVHTGERPYKCTHCPKSFTASSILRTHLRQHSGERPFRCKYCVKAFASHAAHDSHVRRTHAGQDNKSTTCAVCRKTCSSTMELKLHMTTHSSSNFTTTNYQDGRMQHSVSMMANNIAERSLQALETTVIDKSQVNNNILSSV